MPAMDCHPKPKSPEARAGSPGPSAACLQAHLSTLYALSQYSRHVFASPLGPFPFDGRHAYVPRFAFFGPHASEDSWSLAFLAGFDHRDLRASQALLALAGLLAGDAEAGHGLNLTFFPLVDAAGLFLGAPDRNLASAHWGRSDIPEIQLLEKDARQRGYHGFVRVETAQPGAEEIEVLVRRPGIEGSPPDLDLITSDEAQGVPVRFEFESRAFPDRGPLSAAEDLPFNPFELTVRVPAAWPGETYRKSVATLLDRFLRRYRANQAYGQHL
jgi:hypothetical protein